jgi:uncharacterized membrane protein
MLTALIATIITVVTGSIFAYLALTYTPRTAVYNPSDEYPNWMSGMMGSGMMGGYATNPPTSQNSIVAQSSSTSFVSLGYLALIAGAIASTCGLTYLLAFPKKQLNVAPLTSVNTTKSYTSNPSGTTKDESPYESILKTSTDEERHVLNVLKAHKGKYLQKYIKNETGLSRLKTHRIVSRLAERGIITMKKFGNTNEIHLVSWLQNTEAQEQVLPIPV